jgi:tripartite-type tricarboxylate transporter receptor subunit TctC
LLAEVPTLSEVGVKGVQVSAWHARWTPEGCPRRWWRS